MSLRISATETTTILEGAELAERSHLPNKEENLDVKDLNVQLVRGNLPKTATGNILRFLGMGEGHIGRYSQNPAAATGGGVADRGRRTKSKDAIAGWCERLRVHSSSG